MFRRLVINKHMGEFWFLMDAVWTNKWVEFVMGMADPPGEITNSNLFVKEDQDQAWRPCERLCSKSYPRADLHSFIVVLR